MSTPNHDFDVAVVGAGPAGSATARRLAQHGCSVALIERTHFSEPRVGESLAPGVRPLLTELGVWDEFIALNPLGSYGTRSVWGEATPREHSHLMSAYGRGWHVDRSAFDRMLAEAAAAAGADLRCGSALVHCKAADDGRWWLRLDEQDSDDVPRRSTILRSRVLIEATGRAAHLARWVGAERIMFDCLVGVAVVFGDIDTSREGFILVETSPDGWWYSAPVPPGRMIAMLMTDSDICGRASLSTLARWREVLRRAPETFARVVGTELWGPRVFSAVSQRLRRPDVDAPWIAVGDAVLGVDPISGSGVSRALRTACAGSETTLAVLDGQTSKAIRAYEADRDVECSAYLHERAMYYGNEQRWRESLFWQRRAAAVARVVS